MAILIMIAILILPGMVYAEGKGTTGAQFLKLPVGPRPAALGGTFAGVADDVNAIWWNPAGLGFIQDLQFIGMYNQWFEEIKYEYLGYAQGLGDFGTLGASAIYLHMDEITRYDWAGNEEGAFTASDLAATLSYGRALNQNLSLGTNLKYIRQLNEDYKATGYALDVGGLLRVGKGLSLGTSVQNIRLGEKITFIEEGDELPLIVKAGGSLRMLDDNLLLAVDANMPNDNDTSIHAGVEYWIHNLIAARVGYKSRSDLGSSSHWSYGFGLRWRDYGFDAAYLPYGDLGDTYLFSLLVRFGKDQNPEYRSQKSEDRSQRTEVRGQRRV